MLRFLLFIFLLVVSTSAQAQNKIDLTQWSQLPVLHEGRIKPLDSFARTHLKQFSGQENFREKPARSWLADSLFLPDEAVTHSIFKIKNNHDYGCLLYTSPSPRDS